MSYSEKHKRNTSPILRTTSEDRSKLGQNKENYIQYLEQQLEKTSKIIYQKYEERMRLVEETQQEHDRILQNLQNYQQENINIRNHINISMDEIYSNELTKQKMYNEKIEYELNEIRQTYQKESPMIQEFELILNKKTDVIMNELKQSALKSDYQKLEQRLCRLELNLKQDQQQKANESERVLNSSLTNQQQLNDLKIVLDSIIQDQEQKKQQRKSQLQQTRDSITKESIYTESENQVKKPGREMKENIKKLENKRNKSKSSMSRSGSRNARLETIKKQKQENVKELIKKHKQLSQKQI